MNLLFCVRSAVMAYFVHLVMLLRLQHLRSLCLLANNHRNRKPLNSILRLIVKIPESSDTELILHFLDFLLKSLVVGSCHHHHFLVFYFSDVDGALSSLSPPLLIVFSA